MILMMMKLLCLIVNVLMIHGSAVATDFSLPAIPTNTHGAGRTSNGKLELLGAPPKDTFHFPAHSHMHGAPVRAPQLHNPMKPASIAVAPSMPSFERPAKRNVHGSAYSHSILLHKHHQGRHKVSSYTSESSAFPPRYEGPSVAPFQSPFHHRTSHSFVLAPAPSPLGLTEDSDSPAIPPLYSKRKMQAPPPSLVWKLPPPPPNSDCASVTCAEPLTNSAPGSPCACVWPIQVKLRFEVALYTFFPLVSELAKEIAASISLNHSQVRVTGANSASQQLEKTTVLINLVPQAIKFSDSVALTIYHKFWHKQVHMNQSLFGDYEVLYVHYPDLPPSPPMASSSSISSHSLPYTAHGNNDQAIKPLGVDVPRKRKDSHQRNMIGVIVLSCLLALIIIMVIILAFLLKCGVPVWQSEKDQGTKLSSNVKQLGMARDIPHVKSKSVPASLPYRSNGLAYKGYAKVFTLNDIERATNNFDPSKVIGEGGFGIVYRGILANELEVAIKVLKRDDRHGSREFLAEVEMLSRLHHRNLVKLLGICTDERVRCLVYELIPNGSVESHLHGCDKKNDPLDWGTRMKIALGAARGLAYLHEDSNPSVIHRDFKSSNILLDHDFIPKVSDFGLARAAMDEMNNQFSTHVMGTFGYLAPEYAMTGNLLVKSDVYSYGVVLLELLTGRKPVNLSQPPGQENLVGWARPLLTDKEGLETIADPSMKSTVSYDSLAKVAAIASMCVQPEASHRPFMGEVVQALKLVCSEFEEQIHESYKPKNILDSVDVKISKDSSKITEATGSFLSKLRPWNTSDHDAKLASPASDFLGAGTGNEEKEIQSPIRLCRSGPIRTEKSRKFWKSLGSSSKGSKSEHEMSLKLWPGTY